MLDLPLLAASTRPFFSQVRTDRPAAALEEMTAEAAGLGEDERTLLRLLRESLGLGPLRNELLGVPGGLLISLFSASAPYANLCSLIALSNGISPLPTYCPENGCLPKNSSWKITTANPKLSCSGFRSISLNATSCNSGGVYSAKPPSHLNVLPSIETWKLSQSSRYTVAFLVTSVFFGLTSPITNPCSWITLTALAMFAATWIRNAHDASGNFCKRLFGLCSACTSSAPI